MESTITAITIPEGFVPLPSDNGFIEHNGPICYKREADGQVVFGAPITQARCNIVGTCHGGWIASLLDMVLPLSARLTDDDLAERYVLTVNMSIDYLAPAPLGSWVEGRGQTLRRTKRLLFVQGLLSIDGEPITRGSAVLRIGDPAPRLV